MLSSLTPFEQTIPNRSIQYVKIRIPFAHVLS